MKAYTADELRRAAKWIFRNGGPSETVEILESAAYQLEQRSEELLIAMPIGRDVSVKLYVGGPITAPAIRILIRVLEQVAVHMELDAVCQKDMTLVATSANKAGG